MNEFLEKACNLRHEWLRIAHYEKLIGGVSLRKQRRDATNPDVCAVCLDDLVSPCFVLPLTKFDNSPWCSHVLCRNCVKLVRDNSEDHPFFKGCSLVSCPICRAKAIHNTDEFVFESAYVFCIDRISGILRETKYIHPHDEIANVWRARLVSLRDMLINISCFFVDKSLKGIASLREAIPDPSWVSVLLRSPCTVTCPNGKELNFACVYDVVRGLRKSVLASEYCQLTDEELAGDNNIDPSARQLCSRFADMFYYDFFNCEI